MKVKDFFNLLKETYSSLSPILKVLVPIYFVLVISNIIASIKESILLWKEGIYVIEIKGTIDENMYIDIKRKIDYLKKKKANVKALLLDIDSGGGGVYASIKITNLLLEYTKKKPEINIYSRVYSGYCCSGAYMIASISKKIYVTKDSLLGSIGVIATIPNIDGLLNKLGIKTTTITSGEKKKGLRLTGEHSDEDIKETKKQLVEYHKIFKDIIKDNRKLKNPELFFQNYCDGSVYLGEKSKANDLADEIIVYKDDVIDKIKKEEGLEKKNIEVLYFLGNNFFSISDKKISRNQIIKKIKKNKLNFFKYIVN